ncbi:chorismate synthase [Holzapfeliella floricola]|nr:chorismate synthase [Holzapfeliella floricola]
MMNYLTAGESHGPQLTGILEGIPAGLTIDVDGINDLLAARQGGYGRGNRQQIEHDQIEITGGVRHKKTLGSPISLVIKNIDHNHWKDIMNPLIDATPENTIRNLTRPRPGHADLAGAIKYNHQDLRNVLERSSARETAMRVAIGAICKQLLKQLDIDIVGYVEQVGSKIADQKALLDVQEIENKIKQNDLRVTDQAQVESIHELIDRTKRNRDTLGGVVRVVATNMPVGMGSYVSFDQKLDGKIAGAVMAVNAMKGVEIGDGFATSKNPGSAVMDEIDWQETKGFGRLTDHLGGFEGGMTNGMPVIVKAAMKPIPTLYKPLQSADIKTKEIKKANVERSDTTAIVPASIVIESVVAIELAKVITETFDGSNLERLKRQVADYRKEVLNF